jgi:hypothetical protein
MRHYSETQCQYGFIHKYTADWLYMYFVWVAYILRTGIFTVASITLQNSQNSVSPYSQLLANWPIQFLNGMVVCVCVDSTNPKAWRNPRATIKKQIRILYYMNREWLHPLIINGRKFECGVQGIVQLHAAIHDKVAKSRWSYQLNVSNHVHLMLRFSGGSVWMCNRTSHLSI